MQWALVALGATLGLSVLLAVIWTLAAMAAVMVRETRQKGYPPSLALAAAANHLLAHYWHKLPVPAGNTLPQSGSALVVGLHRCSLDPFLIHAHSSRRIYFLVAKEYTEIPLLDRFFKLIEFIPVDRAKADVGALKSALRYLKEGRIVGIFPEGGIVADGQTYNARSGVAMMALKSGAPVIPAAILGIRPSSNIVTGLLARTAPEVRFGAPVDLSDFRGRKAGPAELEAATKRIMDAIAALERAPAARV